MGITWLDEAIQLYMIVASFSGERCDLAERSAFVLKYIVVTECGGHGTHRRAAGVRRVCDNEQPAPPGPGAAHVRTCQRRRLSVQRHALRQDRIPLACATS